MKSFEFGLYKILSNSDDSAQLIMRSILQSNNQILENCMIFVNKDDPSKIIVVPTTGNEKYEVYTKENNTIRSNGQISKSIEDMIIEKAADNIERSKRESMKIALHKARATRLEKVRSIRETIDTFESKIPQRYKSQFEKILRDIDAINISWRKQIYDEVNAEIGQLNPDVWGQIISWFQQKVLSSSTGMSFYQLRKSFVSAIISISKSPSGTANTIPKIVETDWSAYK